MALKTWWQRRKRHKQFQRKLNVAVFDEMQSSVVKWCKKEDFEKIMQPLYNAIKRANRYTRWKKRLTA